MIINIFNKTVGGGGGGGRVVRWCWVNFQCRSVLQVGQGPTALAVGAGGGCLDIFTLTCSFSPLSPSLWETARYRLKYCLKGPLNPKLPTYLPFHLALQQDSRSHTRQKIVMQITNSNAVVIVHDG